ncbi:unnamed protein product [Hymenolepis diminuta]|uniref:Uncharacterized protein n=1 Tax=Hymenolepis diminuta TaxID=6216 RepID=A0A564YBC5_HYMDI|nr:unnamed protein product [Hymenolepis diminuta]
MLFHLNLKVLHMGMLLSNLCSLFLHIILLNMHLFKVPIPQLPKMLSTTFLSSLAIINQKNSSNRGIISTNMYSL